MSAPAPTTTSPTLAEAFELARRTGAFPDNLFMNWAPDDDDVADARAGAASMLAELYERQADQLEARFDYHDGRAHPKATARRVNAGGDRRRELLETLARARLPVDLTPAADLTEIPNPPLARLRQMAATLRARALRLRQRYPDAGSEIAVGEVGSWRVQQLHELQKARVGHVAAEKRLHLFLGEGRQLGPVGKLELAELERSLAAAAGRRAALEAMVAATDLTPAVTGVM